LHYSVVIPSKTVSNLVPCVEAIFKNEPGLPRERVVVVDDGVDWTEDATRSLVGITVVEGEKPFVYARNCNIGIRAAADSDNVILLNDDAILETPGGFTGLVEAAGHPGFGVVASTTNNVGNRAQFRQNRGEAGIRNESRMVCFVCVAIPRSTLETVGLLDERYVGYGCDDDDYCFSVRKHGLKIGIYDGCYVNHGALRSTFRGMAGAGGDYRPNLERFKQKWGTDNWGRPA
jgi:GT2 family glycosyltransferase